MVQFTVLFYTFPFLLILFCFDITKTEMASKTTPRVPKLGYKGGRVPHLSTRVTLVPSGAGVVCHIQKVKLNLFESIQEICNGKKMD